MKKPLIGITASCIYESSQKLFLGYERMYTNADYVNAVIAAGGIPVILPIVEDIEMIKNQVAAVDGVIIMGGHDVMPQFFDEEPLSCNGEILPKRDVYEMSLIKTSFDINKPIFGICRGLQIINVAFGGSLYQDISLIKRDIQIQHVQKADPKIRTHSIKTESNSILRKTFGETEMVNSFHHMAINKVADNFAVTAKAPDGVIEAIEYKGDHYIVGVQFHPEMLAYDHEPSLNLFKEFVAKCV